LQSGENKQRRNLKEEEQTDFHAELVAALKANERMSAELDVVRNHKATVVEVCLGTKCDCLKFGQENARLKQENQGMKDLLRFLSQDQESDYRSLLCEVESSVR
jgi:hypothetical protein